MDAVKGIFLKSKPTLCEISAIVIPCIYTRMELTTYIKNIKEEIFRILKALSARCSHQSLYLWIRSNKERIELPITHTKVRTRDKRYLLRYRRRVFKCFGYIFGFSESMGICLPDLYALKRSPLNSCFLLSSVPICHLFFPCLGFIYFPIDPASLNKFFMSPFACYCPSVQN